MSGFLQLLLEKLFSVTIKVLPSIGVPVLFVLSTFLQHNLLPPTKDSLPRVNPRVASAKGFSSDYAVPQFLS